MISWGDELNTLLALLKIQNTNIHQMNIIILSLATDLSLTNNSEYQEFIFHFEEFSRCHYNSEGYSQATESVQAYRYILLERLLDTQILAAAEQMEMAISHLESAIREPYIRVNPQILLLNQGIFQLEETQLKIIESLESMLEHHRSAKILQN
ncbi:MAG TPA: hypothetical protein PKA28_00255 [Methylomusa anaerophila]|uniref:hypothetical protein n=1 Tax=Methylomusa anaerophila TaxID=1930071 RepID=UPI000F84BCA3|nr:hypothetical protein [Methylomusa anaerophila]HML86862.1 hypothetical protein [Methylomusa anaerophila]